MYWYHYILAHICFYAGLLYPSTVTTIIQIIKTDMVERKLGRFSLEDLQIVKKNLKIAMGFK